MKTLCKNIFFGLPLFLELSVGKVNAQVPSPEEFFDGGYSVDTLYEDCNNDRMRDMAIYFSDSLNEIKRIDYSSNGSLDVTEVKKCSNSRLPRCSVDSYNSEGNIFRKSKYFYKSDKEVIEYIDYDLDGVWDERKFHHLNVHF